jgi:myosin-5
MLVPLLSRTSEIRDIANKILTKVLKASKSKGLDKYQLRLIEIFFYINILVFLENLRITRLDYCVIRI